MLNTNYNRFTLAFNKVWSHTPTPKISKTFFTTGNNGLYKIHYENQFRDSIFNQVNTYNQLKNCKYYSTTFYVQNAAEFNKIVVPDGRYYLKPKDGYESHNISVCDVNNGKKQLLFNNNLQFPLIMQKSIEPKLQNGYKADYRVYVLFVKLNEKMHTFVYPICHKRTAGTKYSDNKDALLTTQSKSGAVSKLPNSFIACVKDSISYLQLPADFNIFLVGYDIMEDSTGKPMIIEINSVPNFFHKKIYKKFHTQLIQDIIHMCIHHFKTKNISIKNFIAI